MSPDTSEPPKRNSSKELVAAGLKKIIQQGGCKRSVPKLSEELEAVADTIDHFNSLHFLDRNRLREAFNAHETYHRGEIEKLTAQVEALIERVRNLEYRQPKRSNHSYEPEPR